MLTGGVIYDPSPSQYCVCENAQGMQQPIPAKARVELIFFFFSRLCWPRPLQPLVRDWNDSCLGGTAATAGCVFGYSGMDKNALRGFSEHSVFVGTPAMTTGLANVGNSFGGQSHPTIVSGPIKYQTSAVDEDDDDVVFIEPVQIPQNPPPVTTDPRSNTFPSSRNGEIQVHDLRSRPPPKEIDSQRESISETIIIDDDDPEPTLVQDNIASGYHERRIADSNRTNDMDFSSSSFSRSKVNAGLGVSGITTEPDSEIRIANVTTLETGMSTVSDGRLGSTEGRDMNLMITHVTSLQNTNLGDVSNGLQSSNFGINIQTYPPSLTSQTKTGVGPFNPGRMNVTGDVFQNGESTTPHNPDSWISQSASFPRNQKQPGVDSMSPVASLPKQVFQPSPQQQPPKPVKVTCANCKKPLQKGQTAYQRKGSAHLFCSTTCLSTFSHKPAPKKLCTMCKKDITTMKGTIVAQVDSSESFQEFCSTSCLSLYEDKQNSAKNLNKSRCTICGKLTEIRHEVSFKSMTHKLCSDHCFNRYRMANGLIMNCCEQCGEYLPSKGAGNNFLIIDGAQKRFCSAACVSEFKQKHGKLTGCTGCRAQCKFFDMTQCIGANGHMEPYCSTTCMNNHKTKTAKPSLGINCHFCKRNSLPQFQATMPDGKVYNFCSSSCVTKFQTLSVQSSANGQLLPPSDIQLKCNYCKSTFTSKPEILEWENKIYQFCNISCCEDYKKLHCIVTLCEYCQEEKTLHETVKFSGVKKPFCSEGCKLLYKQDFVRRLGLKCVTCNYCLQMCKKAATTESDGVVRDFCSEDCSKKFQDWYYKAARCDCCRTQGTLKEKVQWRGEMKHFCDQHCLLRFYCQQNEPNMLTQKGPENMHYDQAIQSTRSKMVSNSTPAPYPTSCKDMKNKAVLCKPLTMTKATYCKPHMQAKSCQTEEDLTTNYFPLPIPVPVYLPAPMHLYSRNIPVPTPIPVPVPVPLILPASSDCGEKNSEAVELRDELSSNSQEVELLSTTEMTEDESKIECTDVNNEDEVDAFQTISTDMPTPLLDVPYEPDLDIEVDFPRAAEELDTENDFLLPPVFGEEYEEQPRPRSKRKGPKRKAVSDFRSPDDSPDNSECSFPLKYSYGVNAWRYWVKTRMSDDKSGFNELTFTKSVKLKEDLLLHSPDDLNFGLADFVNQVRRPNGEVYAPDSLYYLCLGIQEFLHASGRKDNIFIDLQYHTFGQELNKITRSWQPSILPDGSIFSRVEEDYLWRIKQLGSHSPVALLYTLFYFNTKYFGLKTVEQHLRLAFATVSRKWKKNPITKENKACLCYQVSSLCGSDNEDKISTGKRKHEDDEPVFEQIENTADPSRCPVKLFECYLSKSPQNIHRRKDVFYLQPEHPSSSESAVWYTSSSLDRNTLENMLVRVLLVKDIYDEKDSYELDEDTD
ncbi:zinc finger MYM-type protein 2 isoform X2 [Pleurodeles waltl]|uniref:zinc finger MYM-type protein 2 isoform X2 n=1 Tax=Pleurodeles waltl TaxID=8319 RepID=UPI00370989E2